MLVEYRKCRGWGWLLYDSAFRQQITDLESAKVDQSLYATTFLAYGGKGKFCSRCMAGGGGGGGQLGITKDNVELREGIVMYVKRGQGPKGKETHTYIYILYIHNIG